MKPILCLYTPSTAAAHNKGDFSVCKKLDERSIKVSVDSSRRPSVHYTKASLTQGGEVEKCACLHCLGKILSPSSVFRAMFVYY